MGCFGGYFDVGCCVVVYLVELVGFLSLGEEDMGWMCCCFCVVSGCGSWFSLSILLGGSLKVRNGSWEGVLSEVLGGRSELVSLVVFDWWLCLWGVVYEVRCSG